MPNDFETFRDPLLSVFQSAVEEIGQKLDSSTTKLQRAGVVRSAFSQVREDARNIARQEVGLPQLDQGGMRPRDLKLRQVPRLCTELALRYLKALARKSDDARQQVASEYIGSPCDSAWLATLEEYHRYFGPNGDRATIPYVRAADIGDKVIPIDANARIALFADWGTGARPALDILKDIASHSPDVLIHLGDIYYSGTPHECRENFLTPIDRVFRKGGNQAVYTLSGNHDMYCGGVGLYELIRDLNVAPRDQGASFFCLRSTDEKWQFLAMDTGLHDYSPYGMADALTRIEDDELAWHVRRISEFEGKTILLSHHQLFSSFSTVGPETVLGKRSALNPNLLKAFRALADKGKIVAWFWGHEHSLSIYQPFAGLERGRCIGHGAIPVSTIDDIYRGVDGFDEAPQLIPNTRLGSTGDVWNHGYTILSLQGDSCQAAYYELTPTQRKIFEERF
ncbi:metallophosphoesterase [Rhizobium leguminosarum bv. viciae]|uniref:metallophosphoesterase family protein n=1 Tax=Rhizobium ruizarguesonis TaxID=2081791 RepID=UPI00143F461C|nr:metallophosphoesterase [Rhizobium ruizarguesonis]NKJ71804.1 metallophosphoesterase [Rhizobium leguminosarum bv. viciae]NKQ77759.1 hypothetical protein [Rhizobium ruizarguesonis]